MKFCALDEFAIATNKEIAVNNFFMLIFGLGLLLIIILCKYKYSHQFSHRHISHTLQSGTNSLRNVFLLAKSQHLAVVSLEILNYDERLFANALF